MCLPLSVHTQAFFNIQTKRGDVATWISGANKSSAEKDPLSAGGTSCREMVLSSGRWGQPSIMWERECRCHPPTPPDGSRRIQPWGVFALWDEALPSLMTVRLASLWFPLSTLITQETIKNPRLGVALQTLCIVVISLLFALKLFFIDVCLS